MRTYQEQFEPEIVERIDALVSRLERLTYPTGPSRYYGLELSLCLKSGALAGSMIIATALMEIYIRGLVIYYIAEAQKGWSHPVNVEYELEAMREMNFARLIDSLVDTELFSAEDSITAKHIYKTARIPLQHGLPARFLKKDVSDDFLSAFPACKISKLTSMKDFEDII